MPNRPPGDNEVPEVGPGEAPPTDGAATAERVVVVVLAAGLGRRLRPLTDERPKPLCPVRGAALLDLSVDRAAALSSAIAVNVHHGAAAVLDHLGQGAGVARDRRVHVSHEELEPLGTAGALGRLRSWIDGRAVVVLNSDAWCGASLAPLLDGWDGHRIRALTHRDDVFGPSSRLGGVLMPWSDVAPLAPEPTGLYEVVWRAAMHDGRVDAIRFDDPFVDCGTPAAYLAANLLATDGAGWIDPDTDRPPGSTIHASVVWGGASVAPAERLDLAIRTTHGRTVFIR